MIFVTVGNATVPFSRLLDEVERLAGIGLFSGERVVVQSGNYPGFHPENCANIPFIKMEEFMKMVQEAELVICHAGAGTLLHVLNAGKIPVVMPRRVRYGEVIDDHQLELVKALAEQERVIPALEPADLASAVEKARRMQGRSSAATAPPMVALVSCAVEELLGRVAINSCATRESRSTSSRV